MGSSIDPRANISLAQRCAQDSDLARRLLGEDFAFLDRDTAEDLKYDWTFWGRRNQLLNITWAWSVWLICAGRGFGKSRSGAESVRNAVEDHGCRHIALVARTAADCTRVLVKSILAVCAPWNRPKFERSKCQLTWPNGATATYYSAEKPDSLRGPEHDFAWCDEIAAWKYLEESWSNLIMGLRLPSGLCRVVVTTTPRRIPFLRSLIDDSGTLLTKGSTYDNIANLHPNVRRNLLQWKGTSRERQEIFGDIMGDIDGALWQQEPIDANRITWQEQEERRKSSNPLRFRKIVCGVDPALSDSKDADDTGIIVAGLGFDGKTYILGDYTQHRKTADKWATEIVRVCIKHAVNEIYVETNAGRSLISAVIKNAFRNSGKSPHCPRIAELNSTEDKSTRAEPTQALYEIGMVCHVGRFSELEDEMTSWVPRDLENGKVTRSPNRIDALVFAVNGLNPLGGGSVQMGAATRGMDYRAATMPKTIR